MAPTRRVFVSGPREKYLDERTRDLRQAIFEIWLSNPCSRCISGNVEHWATGTRVKRTTLSRPGLEQVRSQGH